jgi:hypothetical protein
VIGLDKHCLSTTRACTRSCTDGDEIGACAPYLVELGKENEVFRDLIPYSYGSLVRVVVRTAGCNEVKLFFYTLSSFLEASGTLLEVVLETAELCQSICMPGERVLPCNFALDA